MRVLLTGAAGFIGGAVSTALEARGHEVVALDALIEQAHGTASTEAADQRIHRVDELVTLPLEREKRVLGDQDQHQLHATRKARSPSWRGDLLTG